MLSYEEKNLPDTPLPKHRKEELKAFCKRYNDRECPLTDAEKALIDGTALDVGKDVHTAAHIINVVSADSCNIVEYCKREDVGSVYNRFSIKIRKFFKVLDLRKRALEARGKYIVDSFEGSRRDTVRIMQQHVDDGWQVVDASTFYDTEKKEARSVVYFQKIIPEEQPA